MPIFSRARRQHPSQRPVTVERSPEGILNCMDTSTRNELTPAQLTEVRRLISLALQNPSAPKLVDLRVTVDLMFSRFFLVLFVGKDRRQTWRDRPESRGTAILNWLAAVILLIGFNFTFCLSLVLIAYLLKSALNIDLVPGHLRGFGK
ncbi:MAG: hypothetical protein AAGF98_04965 [Cyanobacteria bacterium P01_H01_bin.153]